MEQALETLGDLIKTHKEKPTLKLSDFDQGVNEGLILARRALLNERSASQPTNAADFIYCQACRRMADSEKLYCMSCGKRLSR